MALIPFRDFPKNCVNCELYKVRYALVGISREIVGRSDPIRRVLNSMTCDSQIDVKSANHALEITILKTSFRLGLACVLALAVVAEANACASASIGRTIQGAQFKVELSASLPDAKILTALGPTQRK
ncbi:hypothetical protein [Massilia eburnea]|uniref:hypothetical protein n=1 Tax=Massilia eburnea TaxID=1776165 RepID=UPI0014781DE6|nr:hypothetical protein [Massilia eburnea]